MPFPKGVGDDWYCCGWNGFVRLDGGPGRGPDSWSGWRHPDGMHSSLGVVHVELVEFLLGLGFL